MSKRKLNFSVLMIILISFAGVVVGQQRTAMMADQTLRSNGRVNPSTLGLEMSVPLAAYPGRGGMDIPITLQYSSKLWRMEFKGVDSPQTPGDCHTHYTPRYGELSASGWTTDVTRPYIEYTGWDNPFDDLGKGASEPGFGGCGSSDFTGSSIIRRITAHLPGGSSFELRPDDTVAVYWPNTPSNVSKDGTYYSTDGSNLIYVEGSGTYRLRLTDGSYIDFSSSLSSLTTGGQSRTVRYAVSRTDKTGANTITYNAPDGTYPNGSITDTLGRVIGNPLGLNAPSTPTPTASPQEYLIPGFGTSDITYKLHWKKLKDTTAEESGLTNFSDTLCYKSKGNRNFGAPQPPGGSCILFDDGFDTYPTDFVVSNPADGEFNPIVLTQIELPDGRAYILGYDKFGRINRIEYPTGGFETVTYSSVATLAWSTPAAVSQTNFGVSQRKIYESSEADPITWSYGITPQTVSPYGLVVRTVAPNGTKNDRYLIRGEEYTVCANDICSGGYGYGTTLAGMPFEEHVYSPEDDLLSKTVNTWDETSLSISNGNGAYTATADWHPRLTKVEHITYDPSTSDLVSATTATDYEGNLSLRSTAVNPSVVRQYGYSTTAGTLGSLERSTETAYQTGSDYTNRNLRSLPSQVVTKDATGNVKAKAEFSYDESGYGVSGVYGLLTKTTSWHDIANNLSVNTKVKYDAYGNAVESTDANGNVSTVTYSSTYAYAYPTSVTTPVPDPSGIYGSNTAFTTTTTYDYNTGLTLTSTDANGAITEMEYDDPLLRPTKVLTASGTSLEAETVTEYGAGTSAPTRWVKVRTQIDQTNWKEAISWYDGIGRNILSQSVDNGQDDVFVVTCYDDMGRVAKTSNPVRDGSAPTCSSSLEWTTPAYDDLGRTTSVTTPDNAVVNTAYSLATSGSQIGTVVTVEDQAGKLRRSITDALGQLVRVDEPNSSNQLGAINNPNQPTYYYYNTLGKMVRVNQGAQNRYFIHDSLGRLLRVRQPEQEVNTNLNTSGNPDNNSWTAGFTYDNNGNVLTATDAMGTTITNTYDALNRVTQRSYNDSPQTPTVSFYYDGNGLPDVPDNSIGKLTKVTSSVSESRYTEFDVVGRLKEFRQITDGQTYTSKYTYNLSGALIEEEYPSGRVVKNVLDNNGDLSIVQSRKNPNHGFWNYADHFSYNAAGAITKMQLGNGLWETAQFNARLQSTQLGLGTVPTGASLWKVDYEFGELQTNGTVDATKNTGNIGRQTLTVPGTSFVQSYKYDPLHRLIEAVEKTDTTTNWSQDFEYDRYGNRVGIDQAIGLQTLTTTPAVDPNTNRFTSNDFAYDKNGNIVEDIDAISSLPREFIFNGDNKQVEVKKDSITIGRYYYDGEGKRVKKVTDTETTVFVYSSGKLIAEYSTQLSSTPSVAYTTTDHLGSPRIITNELGQVKSRRDFMPFGEELYTGVGDRTGDAGLKYSSSEDDVRQKFTGYQKDNETNLDFAEARMYASALGRFTAVDPLLASGKSANPQTFNRYVYVLNKPLQFVDPTGESPTTHTDRDGNVTSVDDDGSLDVIRHLDVKSDGSTDTSVCGDDCAIVMGQTEYWDEFRDHSDETGEIKDTVARGAKIIFGTSFDQDISKLNQEATNSNLGAVEVAYQSTSGQKYDIKTNDAIAPNGPNTGRLLNGKYATARSAGNYLAGMNGATTPLKVPRVLQLGPIPIPIGVKNVPLDQDSYMKIAGGLHKAGKTGAIAGAAGRSYGPAPYYGEIEHAGRRIVSGFQAGLRKRK